MFPGNKKLVMNDCIHCSVITKYKLLMFMCFNNMGDIDNFKVKSNAMIKIRIWSFEDFNLIQSPICSRIVACIRSGFKKQRGGRGSNIADFEMT
jgi:hypothetical protein